MKLKITIKNIAPFKDVELELSKPITIVYGTSGTGKTTLLEMVGCLASALRDPEIAKKCLDIRLDVKRRLPDGEGEIEVLLESGGLRARVKAVIRREIKVEPSCEGVERCSDIHLEPMVIPEGRHVPLYYMSMIASEALFPLFWKLAPHMASLYAGVEQIPEFQDLKERFAMLGIFESYIKLLSKVALDPRLSSAASIWIRHIVGSWIGRPVKNVDLSRLEVDGVPLYLDSLGVREFVSLIPALVALTGLDEYQRMDSPRLIAVDSLGLGLTRKELFLLSTALARLVAKMMEEVEGFDAMLILATHSELVHEAVVLEASGRRSQVDELLKKDLKVESLLPPAVGAPKRSIGPEHYEVAELYTGTDGFTECRSIQGLPDYVRRIDEVVFKVFYSA